MTLLAYHLTGPTLRDGRLLPAIGESLIHDGPVEICKSGLHASERLTDALAYAPVGATLLHRVECEDAVERHTDKFVCRRRTIVASWPLRIESLRVLAGECAAVGCWAAGLDSETYQLAAAATTSYRLGEIGSEALRERWAAARDAARAAARDAARAAARDAARAAARAAAGDAAWAAAGDAAWAAAWAAFEARAVVLLTGGAP